MGRGDEDVLLSNILYVQSAGGEIAGSDFKVEEIVRVSGPGAIVEKPCLVRLVGYWEHAPAMTEFLLRPDHDIQEVIRDGVHLANGTKVYLKTDNTRIEHRYRNVFQRDAVDVVLVNGGNAKVFADGDRQKVPPGPSVEGHLLDQRVKGLTGFELVIFDKRGDPRPLSEQLPEGCRAVLAGSR